MGGSIITKKLNVIFLAFVLLIIILSICSYQLIQIKQSNEKLQQYLKETLSSNYSDMYQDVVQLIKLHNEGKKVEFVEWKRALVSTSLVDTTSKALHKTYNMKSVEKQKLDSIEKTSYYIQSFFSQMFDYYELEQEGFQLRTCKPTSFNSEAEIAEELNRISSVLNAVNIPQNIDGLTVYNVIIENWDIISAQQLFMCGS